MTRKTPCTFERKAQGAVVPKRSDWKRCNAIPCEYITSFLLLASVRFPVLFCQKRNDARQYGSVSFSLLSSNFYCSDKHPKSQVVFTLLMTTCKKRGCFHLPVPPIAAYHSLAERTNRETPTLEYIDTRKVC